MRMRWFLAAAIGVLVVAGCGKSGGPAGGAGADACALIVETGALFGAGAVVTPGRGDGKIAGDCSWASADGARGGGLMLYTAQSLGPDTPAATMAHLAETWNAMTETPLAPIAGLGDEAQIATDLPGYQTQILVRKGDKLIALQAWSGDSAMRGEALARRMAEAAAANL